MGEQPKDPPIKVTDRRSASHEEPAPAGAAATAREAVQQGPSGPDPSRTEVGARAAARTIDFTTFAFSLGSSAMMHLGVAPDPTTGHEGRDLALAAETIDLLAMLQQKTRGNLTAEEERFLGALLYDLRLRYVQAAKG